MPNIPPQPPAVTPPSRRSAAIGLMAFWLLAPVGRAQPAMQTIANQNPLPLRNLQIEVRQVLARRLEQGGAQVEGARVQLESGGGASAQAGLRLGQQQEQLAGTNTQMALVLNGHSTRIALRGSRPFRLMQTQFRNGRPVLVPGVAMLEASTGFAATPRWDGSDQVELELATTDPASSNATALVLPLGEWVTVAQSESGNQSSRSGLLGQSSESEQSSSELQVRLTVR